VYHDRGQDGLNYAMIRLFTSCRAAIVDKRSSGDLLISCIWIGLLTMTSHRSMAGTLNMAPGYCARNGSSSTTRGAYVMKQVHLLAALSDHLFSIEYEADCSEVGV